jgi:hypothetical protein
MIWNYVLNVIPETDCKCDILIRRKDGDLEQYFSEYDSLMKRWLLPQISEEKSDEYEAVHYWRAL